MQIQTNIGLEGEPGAERMETQMKHLLFASAFVLMAVSGALAADARNVTVINATGYGIKFLGFNNPGDSDWSDNELGSVLPDGGNVYVKFNSADEGCTWNIKIEWADPGYPGVLWENVDLCHVSKLTLHYDRDHDKTSFDAQ